MSFLAGEITEEDFRPFRLKHGIYGQRQTGVQMVRCKIPSGLLTADQVNQLARVADEFGGGTGHLTTRQNIQYHFVPLNRVADLMHVLADVGLTNREACYNTVRNVTACAWAGIAEDEVFDVRPYAQRLAYAFLRKDLTGNLPRKFKFAFDGCRHQDCIQGAINDVGLRAEIRDGKRGFRMIIGGGLGPLPTEAQLFDEFVPEDRLLNWSEAVHPRLQSIRQPQEQEHRAHEVRDAQPRPRLAEGTDRQRVRRYREERRNRVARNGTRRLRRLSNRNRSRWAMERSFRWPVRPFPATRPTMPGSRAT